jgi:hypothetical protein
MLFLLAMEPLNLLFKKSQALNLLGKLQPNCNTCNISMYADDATLFIKLSKQEVQVIDFILNMFAQASGLVTNMAKTHYFPIRCAGLDLQFLNQTLPHFHTFTLGCL